jgi:hypothetical protein
MLPSHPPRLETSSVLNRDHSVDSGFRYCLGTLESTAILNLMIRWSDTDVSPVTLQSTISCQMTVEDSEMSMTSDLSRVTNL